MLIQSPSIFNSDYAFLRLCRRTSKLRCIPLAEGVEADLYSAIDLNDNNHNSSITTCLNMFVISHRD